MIRPTIAYSSKIWTLSKIQEKQINKIKIKCLQRIRNKTKKKNKTRNENFRGKLQIQPINKKIIEGQLRWFWNIMQK